MAADRTPANARGRRTRTALLDAARAIVEAEGYHALTMAAAAERAGVTRRAVYLHFSSRAELVTALFAHVTDAEGLAESTRAVWSAPDAVTALRRWAEHLARFHPRVLAVGQANDRVRHTDPDASFVWRLVTDDWREQCLRLTRRLAEEGRLAAHWTPDTAADLLWALMSFDVVEALLVRCGWSPADYAERLWALYRAALVAPDAR
ncbi:TetR/AcrR family transcriptional regulator [Allonocardiopsis opalescens]|uniref:TetR family transcriptional regulator n=1 Tax=Allonocardiopsis opalescens TaxID=1144618 RepID=A0A2T0Q5L7_9ACTN|nr:TetR/AcrR family transcriptional regulator [Allonocardiopsis opalescens]PRX99117.1 TetR family transcriptional regulator [Allonocardiopsis opalescens]